jgi:transcriptional regulator with XRE-family HTH domain
MHDAAPDTMHDLLRDAIPIAGELLVRHVDASRKRRKKAEKKPQRGGAKQGIDYAAIELARIVGARARDIRLAKGLSLETMWQRGAPTPSMLSEIERGHVNSKVDTLATIARAMDVTVALLFYDPKHDKHDKHDDALFIAANVDAFAAKRLLFVYQEGRGMEADGKV